MDPKLLREETRPEHEATEALMPLSGADFTRDLYAEVLQTMLPVVEGWERFAEQDAPADLRELLPARRRSHLLRQDLAALGVRVSGQKTEGVSWGEVVGASQEAPDFQAAFLGALYVMEGSTLGGRFLAKHVASVLGLSQGEATAYFEGHGASTGAMWREVTEKISGIPDTSGPVLIASAKRAFVAFGDAMRRGRFAMRLTHE